MGSAPAGGWSVLVSIMKLIATPTPMETDHGALPNKWLHFRIHMEEYVSIMVKPSLYS